MSFRVLLCLLFLAPVVSGELGALADRQGCETSCPDDDERGQCAPDCSDCTCCTHLRSIALVGAAEPVPVLDAGPNIEAVVRPPRSPDLRAIRHVPKRLA